ncbi:MAG: asparagine synthase (glutamine-hydrolyzing) [Ferruginibacter sp.]
MCGVAGFIDFSKNSDEGILKEMTGALQHRGPDDEGFYFKQEYNYQIGLGHRRLSIIELSASGHQPMVYNNYVVIFNGEIYNYKEIQTELKSLGHTFSGDSDTEVILHAFAQWGTSSVDRFIGMFVYIIYDKHDQKCYAFRDRVGVKPFYYYYNNNILLFASELKSIIQHPAYKKDICINSLALYFQYGYIPAPHTIFEHTYKLKPGHYIDLDLKTEELQERKYWDVYDYYNKPKIKISENELMPHLEDLLSSAFNYRMVADVPVGVFLSGGYDSACVTALLQKDRTEKLRTFTIGFEDSEMDEAPYAKKVAAYLGTDHTEYYCNYKEAQDIIPELPFYFDEPFADSSAIPTILVSRMARKSVTVALSADGGDEIFGGYSKYVSLKNSLDKLRKVPKILRPLIGHSMEMVNPGLLPGLRNNYRAKYNFKIAAGLFRDGQLSAPGLLRTATGLTPSFLVAKLLRGHVFNIPDSFFNSEASLNGENSDLDLLMATDFKTYMADDILTKVDRCTMCVSLEGREPLLDHRIIELVATLPDFFKINNGIKKYLLKKIVRKYLPDEMMERPKKGFHVPVEDWMKNELRYLLEEFLDKAKITQQKILDWQTIDGLKQAYLSGSRDAFEPLWAILMFQMWHKQWMEQ